MRLFGRAILKLTAVYAAILLALCIGFSTAIYTIACREIDRERPIAVPGFVIGGGISRNDIISIINERNDETKQALLGQILVTNIIIMTLGVGASYLLARWTLKPIREAYELQSRFVSDASHELRTPLTAISMENEVLLRDRAATKENYKDQVKSNLEEIAKLQSLTNTLLELSRAENAEVKDRKAVTEQIVNILVDNAKKFSPKGSEVKVVRTKTKINVIDKGPGISEEDLPHIFERFYRSDKSRHTDGYGLGLPLAQALATQIGAEITVKNNPKKGATFSVEFQHPQLELTQKKGT